jgi:hypothetical protein
LVLGVAYLLQLNWNLLDWPLPALLLPATTLSLSRRVSRWDAFLLAWIAAQLVAYALYWHAGQFAGPRYLFTVAPALLILAARAPLSVARAAPQLRALVLAATAGCIAAAWLVHTPPYGVVGTASALRQVRKGMKLDLSGALSVLEATRALVSVPELVPQRVTRRLGGLGVSRPERSRIVSVADGCALLEAVSAEEQRAARDSSTVERLRRVKPFAQGAYRVVVADAAFRVSDSASVTPACEAEFLADVKRAMSVSFGQLLLEEPIDAEGRISGDIVFVADLGDHNEVLRERFGDRPWYRIEVPADGGANVAMPAPVLVPYEESGRVPR